MPLEGKFCSGLEEEQRERQEGLVVSQGGATLGFKQLSVLSPG